MVIKETVWHPDTCENPSCILVYSWDTDLPDNLRVHSFVRADRICSAHQGVWTESEAYNKALDHNQRKNKTEGWMLANLTSLLADTNANGSFTWKQGITFNWSFSGVGDARVLTISITGVNLNTNQKNQIQSFCNSTFGVGKVVVL